MNLYLRRCDNNWQNLKLISEFSFTNCRKRFLGSLITILSSKATALATYGSSSNKGKQLTNTLTGDMAVNTIKTLTLGPDLRLDMNPTPKLNIVVGAGISYNNTKYSLQPGFSNNYLSQEYTTSLDWEMPKGFFFATDFNYTINSQRAAGFNVKVPLWNASISKQMLKFNRGELKFSARDLLNRNVGISRNTNNNYIEDSRVLTLRQFFLLSFTYSLSKTGLNNAGGGGMRVIAR